MMDEILSRLRAGRDITSDNAQSVISEMLRGRTDTGTCVDLLRCLAAKRETDDEILGMLDGMAEFAVGVDTDVRGLIDMCGTGGDGLGTFNISTTASFVAAAGSVRVAKHGNRSSMGISGSADIFEYIGYDLMTGPRQARSILNEFGICFLFGPRFHPAMKHVAPARKRIPHRTVFNILGPLSNPAGVRRQLVGVSDSTLLDRLPRILVRRGAECVMTVMATNGMDELSTAATNRLCLVRDGKTVWSTIRPSDLDLHDSAISDIVVGTKQQAMDSFLGVIDGTANRAMIETVALNAAAGLIVGDRADNFDDALDVATDTIESGQALKFLTRFLKRCGDPDILEGIG